MFYQPKLFVAPLAVMGVAAGFMIFMPILAKAQNAPFNVQIPQGQMQQAPIPMGQPSQQSQSIPSGQAPYGAPSFSGNGVMPMAIPPSFNPNSNNFQSAPPSAPSSQSQGTRAGGAQSEVVAFKPKKEISSVLVVKTSEGEFKITLKHDMAPKNVDNFVELALGQKEFIDIRTGKKVKRPFYTGLNCHRVIKGVLIQCGCPFGNGKGGSGERIPDERSSGMKFDRPGVVAMALGRTNSDKGMGYESNSASSQFFITLGPLPEYNDQFTVVGHVTSGMETIRKIASTPTGPTDRPLKRVIIFSIDPDLPPLPPGGPGAMDPMAGPEHSADPSANPVSDAPVKDDSLTAPPALPPPGGGIDPFAMPPPPPPSNP